MELFEKYKKQFDKYGVNTKLRIQHYMAQREAENPSGKRESCYYKTIESLRKTFKTPFQGKSDEFVAKYLKNTEKCANYVYANRMGNGNEASGDGFKYRGGGDFQLTGKGMYASCSKGTGIDFLSNPDIITEEANAVVASLWFWKENNLSELADRDLLDSISDRINLGRLTPKIGDANGYEHRKVALAKWKSKLK
jgi:putative chitinase